MIEDGIIAACCSKGEKLLEDFMGMTIMYLTLAKLLHSERD